MNYNSAVHRSMTHWAVDRVEQKINEYTGEENQIDMVNIDFINSNAKSPGIIEKLKTSRYQNIVNILYKIDIGCNSNNLPFHLFKIIFSRSTKKLLSQTESKNTKLETCNNTTKVRQECIT